MRFRTSTRKANRLQCVLAVIMVIFGMILISAGFMWPPTAVIHNSVLVAFGEVLTFAGALLGIDYRYKFKLEIDDRDRERYREQDDIERGDSLE